MSKSFRCKIPPFRIIRRPIHLQSTFSKILGTIIIVTFKNVLQELFGKSLNPHFFNELSIPFINPVLVTKLSLKF